MADEAGVAERQKQKNLPDEEIIQLIVNGEPTFLDDETTDRHVLYAASKVLGHLCSNEENDFMQCKAQDENPRACAPENLALTRCTHEVLERLSDACPDEVADHVLCLDENYGIISSPKCRDAEYRVRVCVQAKFGFDSGLEEFKRRTASLRTWQRMRGMKVPEPYTEEQKQKFAEDVQAYVSAQHSRKEGSLS